MKNMYFDAFNKDILTQEQLNALGLADAALVRLKDLSIFPLRIIRDEIDDPETEGLRPVAQPMPDPENPSQYIQRLEKYNVLEDLKKAKLEELANRRWSVQSANFIFEDGTVVKTASEDLSRMLTTLQGAQAAQASNNLDNTDRIDFKAANGWISLTADELHTMINTISGYIQECYTNERAISDELSRAESIEALNAIDLNNGWPDNSRFVFPEESQVQDDKDNMEEDEDG